MFVPPPGNEINGRYIWSKYQESNSRDYISRHPIQVAKNLPWIYGNFESPIYISDKTGNNLLFNYSTFCIGWTLGAIYCSSPFTEINMPKGEITQISYKITSISGIFIKLKILFYGINYPI
ncbi:hypothetical protein LPTSP2_39140 [Leptospira ellinghausenii]|uniref:Uncharacterized protein n=1 Tax=Leptospira ellinghausenii TaxID=1917822 RepID=A0A2P2DJ51_9LEPT|nr:hypothetical protein [Leptospira ellinghausenii]GBF44611.1 hypothetical protein LPTSP2_39140 [Leptospira ellinghausenii]